MTSDKDTTYETHLIAKILRYITPITALSLVALITFQLPRIVSMILLAFLLSYVFRPLIQFLEHRGFTKNTATLILFGTTAIVAGVILWVAIPMLWEQGDALRQRLTEQNFTLLVEDQLRQVEDRFNFIPQGTLIEQVDFAYGWILDQLGKLLRNIYVFLEYMLIVPFILFFIIRDGNKFKRGLFNFIPNSFFEMTFNLFHKIDKKLGAYIRGIVFESMIIALLNIIGFWLAGVPYAVLIGLFAGFCNIVPYFGPIVGGIPALIVKFVENQVFVELIPVLLVLAMVQFIDNIWAKPFVMSRSMNIHPLLVILAVIGGGKLFGILGMILSIPFASIMVVVFGEINWAIKNYRFQV